MDASGRGVDASGREMDASGREVNASGREIYVSWREVIVSGSDIKTGKTLKIERKCTFLFPLNLNSAEISILREAGIWDLCHLKHMTWMERKLQFCPIKKHRREYIKQL